MRSHGWLPVPPSGRMRPPTTALCNRSAGEWGRRRRSVKGEHFVSARKRVAPRRAYSQRLAPHRARCPQCRRGSAGSSQWLPTSRHVPPRTAAPAMASGHARGSRHNVQVRAGPCHRVLRLVWAVSSGLHCCCWRNSRGGRRLLLALVLVREWHVVVVHRFGPHAAAIGAKKRSLSAPEDYVPFILRFLVTVSVKTEEEIRSHVFRSF